MSGPVAVDTLSPVGSMRDDHGVQMLKERPELTRWWIFYGIAATCARSPKQVLELPQALRDRGGSTITKRAPWWPYVAERYVQERMRPGMRVFEYGGGGSTLWLADQGAEVTTVEHDAQWYQVLTESAPEATVLLREPQDSGQHRGYQSGGYFDGYVDAVEQAGNDLDLVIVDGRARVACALAAMSHLKSGGLLLLDDAQRARYRPALDALATWPVFVGEGIKGGPLAATTLIWTKP